MISKKLVGKLRIVANNRHCQTVILALMFCEVKYVAMMVKPMLFFKDRETSTSQRDTIRIPGGKDYQKYFSLPHVPLKCSPGLLTKTVCNNKRDAKSVWCATHGKLTNQVYGIAHSN